MMLRLGSVLLLFTAAMLPIPVTAQGRMTYCCNDSSGKQVCSDVLPKECYGRAYREINRQGVTVKRVDAPMTAEQRTAKEAEDKKAKEEEVKRLEQDRRNRALLATYASEKDIDYVRDRAVADLQRSIKAVQDKQAELAKLKETLDAEAQFYRKKSMPPKLQTQIRDNDAEMKAQQATIESKQKEIEALRTRYEDEKVRYRELTKTKAAGRSEAPNPTPTGADTRPR